MANSKEAATPPPKKKMVRSPNYPSLSLGDALAKARIVYDIEKTIPTTPQVMLGHLGYDKPDSGPAGRTFSALRQYGLITEPESGRWRISDKCFRYFELPEESPERATILREAGLRPALFKELIARYKDTLPSDASLRSDLVIGKGFNPNTVLDFIKAFRATVNLAKLLDGGYNEPANEPDSEEVHKPLQNPTTGVVPQVNPKVTIPAGGARVEDARKAAEWSLNLSRDSEAKVIIFGRPSQEAIDKLAKFLDLQKDTFPTKEELERPRLAVWRNKDHDQPVTVTGELGEKDGKRFYAAEETSTGIPEDELEFEDAKAKGAV